jgi:signal transduction histidine kinase
VRFAGRRNRPSRPPGRPSPSRRDVVLAAVLCIVDMAIFSRVARSATPALSAPVVALSFLPLPWRRIYPRSVFALVWVAAGAAAILEPTHPPLLSLLVAVYSVAAYRPLRDAIIATVAAYALYAPVATASEAAEARTLGTSLSTATFVAIILLYGICFGGAAVIGRWVRGSRLQIDTLEERRKLAAAEAVAAERSRIARELHDIVSHSVSVMVLQAAGARRVIAGEPDRAEQALAQIESVGKQAMSELRRLLGVLLDGDSGEDGQTELGPQPGLSNLPSLIDTFRATGLRIAVAVAGRPLALDDSVDLSAYRIVQEALTNAGKHAGAGTTVTIEQDWHETEMVLTITDDGPGSAGDPALSTGHGLVGLRERARAVGGSLEAGPLSAGGFAVSARLPVAHVATPGPELVREGSGES